MGRVEDYRHRYDEVRVALEQWLGDQVRSDLQSWASGDVAVQYFGAKAHSLDALCLIARYAEQIPYVLAAQVDVALGEGYSWSEVATALGVSRQAARKPFGRFTAGPWWSRMSPEQRTALILGEDHDLVDRGE